MTHRVLCADADTDSRATTVERIETELDDIVAVVDTAGTVSDAEALLTAETSAVITEYEFPDGTGFDLINTARETCPDAGCVLYTDTDPDTIDTGALHHSVTEFVGKDSLFGAERLTQLLRMTIETGVQRSYPLPQNEAERVAALETYDLDDPTLQESLDRVTGLAGAHFDVDIASINIINEHSQDFLACYGAVDDWETMDREDSICTFTILEDDGVMVVEDVSEDSRFESRSEGLIDIGIRAYMGANLVTSSGLVIGSLCIYDEEPRSFSEADKTFLKDLAATAMDLIELHARIDTASPADGGDR